MVQIAFVTMDDGGPAVTPSMLEKAWRKIWPDEEPLSLDGCQAPALAFPFMGGTGMVGFMPGPVPWSDLEGPARCAWHWKDATKILKAHRCHLIVGVSDGDEPEGGDQKAKQPAAKKRRRQSADSHRQLLDQSIRLTLLTAAVCAAAQRASGVYWSAGTAVTPAETFVKLAQEMTPESFPLHAWIEFRIFPDDEGKRWSVFTTGLAALGLMEIEVRDVLGEPPDLVTRVMDVAQYLVQEGPVLKDGDTLGSSEEEKLLIHHVRSKWDREGPVLWIEM
jgi:hypothetical protein